MFRWRPIASYEDVQAARARLWGGAGPADPLVPDAVVGAALPFTMAGGVYVVASKGTETAVEAPGGTRTGPMPVGKTEKPVGRPDATQMRMHLARGNEAGDEAGRRMAKYLSREWVEAGRAHVENDDRLVELTRGVRASVLCVVHDVPDHADEVFYIAFDDGRIVDLYSGDKAVFDSLGKVPSFEVHGDYATYMRIQEGHLTQTTAVMRGMLRLKGSWLKALRYIRALEELTTILREVPTEY